MLCVIAVFLQSAVCVPILGIYSVQPYSISSPRLSAVIDGSFN